MSSEQKNVNEPNWEEVSPVLRPQNYFSDRDREVAQRSPETVQDKKPPRDHDAPH